METAIIVHVAGQRLLVQGICALLNGFSDMRAIEAVPFVLAKDTHHAERSPVLVVVHPVIGKSEPYEDYPLALRVTMEDPRPILLPAAQGYPVNRVVLVTPREELNLIAACAVGLQIFLGLEDDANILRQGVIAGVRGEAYCSSAVTPCFLESVRHQSHSPCVNHEVTGSLSKREREIAVLAASGLSNAEIAEREFIGISTVKAHLTQVYDKLSICRRSQISAALRISGENPTKV